MLPFALTLALILSAPPLATEDPPDGPDALRRIEQEFDTFVRVGGMIDSMEAIFLDPDLNALVARLEEGAMTPAQMVGGAGNISGELPSVVGIGVDEDALDMLGAVIQGIVALNILNGALDPGSGMPTGAHPEEVGRLMGELVDIVTSQVRRGRFALAMRPPEGGDAQELLDGLREGFSGFEPNPVSEIPGGVRVDFGLLLRDPMTVQMIKGPLMFLGAKMSDTQRFTDHLTSLSCTLDARIEGEWATMRLTIGSLAAGEEGAAPPKDRPELRRYGRYPDSDPPHLYIRWHLDALLDDVEEGAAMWERWKSTELGKSAARLDAAGFLDDLPTLVRQVRSFGATGVQTLHLGRTVRWHGRLDAPERWSDLRGTPLSRAIPPDAAWWALDGTQSLASVLYDIALEAEGRLELRSLFGDMPEVGSFLEDYYENTAAARVVLRAAADALPLGYGIVVDGARAGRVTVHPADDPGEAVALDAFPIPAGALLIRTDAPAEVRERMNALVAALAEGFLEGGEPAPFLVEQDLGLGVPTHRLDLEPFLARSGMTIRLETADDDEIWHSAELEGVLVLSNSKRCTTRLRDTLAAGKGPGRVGGDRPVPIAGADPFGPWASYAASLGTWLAGESPVLTGEGMETVLGAEDRERALEVLSIVSAGLRRFREFEYRETIDGGIRERTMTFTVAPTTRTLARGMLDRDGGRTTAKKLALRWLVAQQHEDGRWSDPGSGPEWDAAVTALAVRALDQELVLRIQDRGLRRAYDRGVEWLLSEQRTGEADGHFGDPAAKNAALTHALALLALAGGPVPNPEHESVIGRAIDRLASMPLGPLDDELAFFLLQAQQAPLIFAQGTLLERGDRFHEFGQSCEGHFRKKGATERDRVPALGVLADTLAISEQDEEYTAKLVAECARLSADLEGAIPWFEVWALADAVETATLFDADDPALTRWRDAWTERLLDQQRPEGKPHAGSWSPEGAPFGGAIYTTVRAVELIDMLEEVSMPPGW